jgi:signal transduction histidine kinase
MIASPAEDAARAAGDSLPRLIKSEVCRIVASQSSAILTPTIAAQSFIVANAAGHAPLALLTAWIVIVGGVHVVRMTLLRRILSDDRRDADVRVRLAVSVSFVSGAAHAASTLFLPYLNLYQQAVQFMVLLGLCAGSVAVNVGQFGIVLGFLGPVLVSVAGFWGWESLAIGHWETGAIALLTLLYGVTLLVLSRDTYRTFARSVAIRLENAELTSRLQAALAETEAASRAKTRFLASASHDLRQPLHTLAFLTAALELRPLDEKGRDILGKMAHALEDLSSEFDMLLDISKLDAGVVPISAAAFEIAPFLARICQPFAELAEGRGLRLATDLAPGLHVSTDRMLLERIVRNLLDNAFKYTPAGSITVSARPCGDRCIISIEDTGIGIAPAEQPRVFEEFYQIDNPERDRRKGLGLGLPIVRRLGQLLGISIEMRSTPGAGTTFDIELPLHAAPAQAATPPKPVQPALRARHILVIDDEAESRLAMEGYLQALGCQVSTAATIAEAKALQQTGSPDCVVADFRLRGNETGMRAIEELRASEPGLPALLITGDSAPDKLSAIAGSGIPVLHKPVSPAALVEHLSRLLDPAKSAA